MNKIGFGVFNKLLENRQIALEKKILTTREKIVRSKKTIGHSLKKINSFFLPSNSCLGLVLAIEL